MTAPLANQDKDAIALDPNFSTTHLMTVSPLSLPTPESPSVQELFPMGLIYADIELLNADDLALLRRGYLQEGQIRKMKVRALVDSGAYMLAINENIKLQLDLPILDEQVAELADGSNIKLEIVGPLEVRFENRATTCRAMVLPGKAEILLGSIPMEDMDVLVNPREQRLIVNPESPYLAKKPLK